MDTSVLYQPLIERDVETIGAAVREFRQGHSSEELFLAVARFCVLAYAPSQHARHAMLAILAAHEVRDEVGDRWDDLLTECARYGAQSRLPWSEPPLLDPPPVDDQERSDLEALREAVAARDRARGERWLARRLDDPDLLRDLFLVASEDFEDLGHKLIVAVAASKLAGILGEKGHYATLRTAIWEMTAYGGSSAVASNAAVDPDALLKSLIDRCVEEKGSIESAHGVFLLDAALQTGEEAVIQRTCAHLHDAFSAEGRGPRAEGRGLPLPIYPLARDYAAYLKAHAVAKRRPSRDFLTAVHDNLETAPSFEEWSFA